jgi:hypothetical protein
MSHAFRRHVAGHKAAWLAHDSLVWGHHSVRSAPKRSANRPLEANKECGATLMTVGDTYFHYSLPYWASNSVPSSEAVTVISMKR